MIRVFVADPDLLMNQRVVATVKTGRPQGLIPLTEIEIWRPARADRDIQRVRSARVRWEA